MKKGYAVVRLCPNGWEVDSYYFGSGPKSARRRADVRRNELNREVKRTEYGVFSAIETEARTGLWFEWEDK